MSDNTGWPKAGDKMRFLGENGYPMEREGALKVLAVGQVLTVESCNVGNFSHSIRFLEVAGNFNGVMFEMDEAPPMTQDSQTLTADDGLAEQMKAAGMRSIEEMLQPDNPYQVHKGMTDLKFFEQWLEHKTSEYQRMMVRRQLDKAPEDDMYEWVLAHAGVFHEVLVNFRAALNQGQG